ncbi:MAG: sensor histidine kinase [Ignavibacteriaceae bacterium]|nr:sensor histidine kinase [Ignavibacteriaceae bacterium]
MQKRIHLVIILQIFLCNSAILFAQNSKELIDSVNSINFEEMVSDLDKSTKIFSDNLNRARKITYPKGEGVTLSNLALVQYLKGNYDKSTQYHIEAIKIFTDNQMYKELSNEYGEFGYQLKRRNLNRAITYMQIAIKTADEHSVPKIFRSKLYDNYGVLKEMQNDADSAIYFYKKALEIKKTSNDSVGIPYSLNKIAVLNASQGKFSEAFGYLNLSDTYRDKEFGNFGRMENLSFRADFFKMQNRTDEAIQSYEKAVKMAEEIDYAYMILYCYKNLTELYKQKNQFEKALLYHQKYTTYKDSINNSETDAKVAQLEIAFETEQKNKLLAQNQFEIKSKTQQLTFLVITLVLLIAIIIGVYKFQQQRRKRVIEELEYKNQIQNSRFEKKMFNEKLNISRELHDNIGSQLTFLISSLDNITYSERSNVLLPKLEMLKDFSRDALFDLRSTIWAMKQEDGDIEKLVLKINETIQKINSSVGNTFIGVENNIRDNKILSSTQMLNLFRIIQEALQNSIKYSSAKEVKIIFSEIKNGFELKITDNGIGFNIENEINGNGMINMKTRCELAGGKFNIKSDSNGTTISCELTSN